METSAPLADPAFIPDHVPRELVYDARITEGAEYLAAPHKFMAELHGKLKLARSEAK